MSRRDLVYSAPNGLEITPYRGNIGNITADAAVTREDTVLEEESFVTKALQTKYPTLKDKRQELKKHTKFLIFKLPFTLWTVKVSKLSKSSGSDFFVFHAIMKQPGTEGPDENWSTNMTRMYISLLNSSERKKIKVLAIPLLGSGQNIKTAAKVLIDVLLAHRRKHLQKIYIVSRGKKDIMGAIMYCRDKMVLTRGNQPEGGTMTARKESRALPGYERHGTIEVTYSFRDGNQGDEHPNPGEPYKGRRCQVYLPDCSEGRKVLGLLKTAFDDRMLTFTIGRSKTSGENNVLKFTGIPLKTRRDGGAEKYGYPDPSYLSSVQEYLKNRGITTGRHVEISGPTGTVHMKRHQTAPARTDLIEQPATIRRTNTAPTPKVIQPAAIECDQVREERSRGNCMFVSLSKQLKRVLHEDIGHSELRAKLVQYLKDNPNQPDNTPYSNFLIGGESWERFLERMSRDGQWGDHLILQAASELYTVEIVVNKDKPDKIEVRPSREWTFQLLLRFSDGCHYESVE